jgi:hypothetical protein
MDEAVLAAKTAYERLNSDTDTDFAAVYKLLFLTDKNKDDPTFKKVTSKSKNQNLRERRTIKADTVQRT